MKTNFYNAKKLIALLFLLGSSIAFAQKVTKTAVDNKGTKNTVLDASSTVITNANNGLNVDVLTDPNNPTVQLGGALTEPTTISTTATFPLTIDATAAAVNVTGLSNTGDLATDKIVVSSTGGQLKTIDASAFLTSGDTSTSAIATGELVYPAVGIPTNATRVWVYRNGVKLVAADFAVGVDQVTLTNATFGPAGSSEVQIGDVIEVQWVK